MAETNHGRNNHRSRLDRSNCCKSSLHVSGNLSICPDKFNKFELRNSLFVVVDQEIEISDKFESVSSRSCHCERSILNCSESKKRERDLALLSIFVSALL